MLVEPLGNRPLDDARVAKARQQLFGSWEMNWMAYNFAHDVSLPGSNGAPVGFLMYHKRKRLKAVRIALIPLDSNTKLLSGRFRRRLRERGWFVNYANFHFGRYLCMKLDGFEAIGCNIKLEFDWSESWLRIPSGLRTEAWQSVHGFGS